MPAVVDHEAGDHDHGGCLVNDADEVALDEQGDLRDDHHGGRVAVVHLPGQVAASSGARTSWDNARRTASWSPFSWPAMS